jgi:hypothetical protein
MSGQYELISHRCRIIHTLVVNIGTENFCVSALTLCDIRLEDAIRVISTLVEPLTMIAVQSDPHNSKIDHIPAIVWYRRLIGRRATDCSSETI